MTYSLDGLLEYLKKIVIADAKNYSKKICESVNSSNCKVNFEEKEVKDYESKIVGYGVYFNPKANPLEIEALIYAGAKLLSKDKLRATYVRKFSLKNGLMLSQEFLSEGDKYNSLVEVLLTSYIYLRKKKIALPQEITEEYNTNPLNALEKVLKKYRDYPI